MAKPNTFQQAVDEAYQQARKIMIERQKKYGPDNIRLFGEKGIVVRSTDKLMRLKRYYFEEDGKKNFEDEKLRDTWIDLVNYGLIALMLIDDRWGLPLEEEAENVRP